MTLGGWAVTTAQQESQPPCRVGIIPEEVEPGCRMGSPGARSQPRGPRNLISRPFPAGVGLIIRGQHGADCFSTAREGPSQTLRDPPQADEAFLSSPDLASLQGMVLGALWTAGQHLGQLHIPGAEPHPAWMLGWIWPPLPQPGRGPDLQPFL